MKYLHAQGYIDGTCLTVTGERRGGGREKPNMGPTLQECNMPVPTTSTLCLPSPHSHPHIYTRGLLPRTACLLSLSTAPQPPLPTSSVSLPCPPVLLPPAGKTVAENLAGCPDLSAGQDVVLPVSSPIKPSGHIQILYGNLAPEGSVAKITGKEGLKFTGQVRRGI